jgi:hypothetical protein
MKFTKLLVALPAVALMTAAVPTDAEARTKSIVKWGAIGLGAAAVGNYMQQNRGYYQQPYYSSYGYSQPYYGGYYQQPYYSGYSYGYSSYPSYGGYYGYGY